MIFDKLKNKIAIKFQSDKCPNVLLCTGISDSLGVPFETMKASNPVLTSWDGKSFLGSVYHKLSPGQWSDDTQMSIIIAESLIENKRFNADDLAKRYVDWIYGSKARGYGRTTKAAIDNLKNGAHWSKSGIVGSCGNGTAMRAAPFGVFYAKKDFSDMFHAVKTDSAITHNSVEAEAGALAVAITTYLTINNKSNEVASFLAVHLPESETKQKILKAYDFAQNDILPEAVLKILGTRADVRQSVPAAMYCYWRYDKFENAIVAAIRSGFDTDTTAAIVGAMFGAKTKLGDIPIGWIENVERSSYLRELDSVLAG